MFILYCLKICKLYTNIILIFPLLTSYDKWSAIIVNSVSLSTDYLNPLLTVIIISYNEVNYLSEAIDSCLRQERDFPIEIIIGDDGSTDGSIDIIESYSKKYDFISYFVQKRNITENIFIPSYRVSDIIKKGLKKAKGKYIQILSGDDFFISNNKFAESVCFLNNRKDFSSYITHFEKYYNNKHIEYIPFVKLTQKKYWAFSYNHISCFIFRNSENIRNKILSHFCDDVGLEYSLLFDGKWKFTKEIMFGYRQREKSIMSSINKLELNLVELMIYENILNTREKKFRFQTNCRYIPALKYVLKNRDQLNNKCFEKYFTGSFTYFIKICKEFDKKSVFYKLLFHLKIIFYSSVWLYFRIIRKLFLYQR